MFSKLFLYPLFFSIIFFLTACSSVKKNSLSTENLTVRQIKKLDQAQEYIQQKKFKKAGEIYDALAKDLRGKPLEVMMLFNGGSSHREAGNCEIAVTRYRRLLDRSLKQIRFKARGLLEISFTYECLGQTRLSFLSLKDITAFRKYLSLEFQKTVYPARLGIAYAATEQLQKSLQYQTLALNGVLQLKKQYTSEKDLSQNLSRLFYFMGRSYTSKSHLNPVPFIVSFPHHQLYLLQSIFLKDNVWSSRSEKELTLIFEKLKMALNSPVLRKKYKNFILTALKKGEILSQNEADSFFIVSYKTKANKIKSLF
ncbi:MAG: tetratricopeptide repeat protein [Bdellovibrionales bacterium]|nr:tetratricopeptide repeat protein [Bdellovibrionales bacterium]